MEVMEDSTMGQLSILCRVPLKTDIPPWWDYTFYEESSRTVTAMDEQFMQAKLGATIFLSASTALAKYAYTWDLVYHACVLASLLVVTITLVQCCYFTTQRFQTGDYCSC
jgi:hypothetical protein